jgi:heme exporter protein C
MAAGERIAGRTTGDWISLGLGVLAVGMTLTALCMIFFYAPPEKTMGIVYKIFYFHVPSAIVMGGLFFLCAIASLGYLMSDDSRMDAFAVTCAELAIIFGVIVLLTGPLWARKAWGTWWTWEPRLAITLITVFIYVAYLAVRSYGTDAMMGRRMAAGIGMLGAPAYYFIKIAVQKWGGNHPKNVVYGKSEGLEDAVIANTFFVSLVAVALLAIWIFWVRFTFHRMRDKIDALRVEMDELDLLDR